MYCYIRWDLVGLQEVVDIRASAPALSLKSVTMGFRTCLSVRIPLPLIVQLFILHAIKFDKLGKLYFELLLQFSVTLVDKALDYRICQRAQLAASVQFGDPVE